MTPTLVVLEATGGYEFDAACALQAAGLAVAVVNPRTAHDFARAMGHWPRPTRSMDACWPPSPVYCTSTASTSACQPYQGEHVLEASGEIIEVASRDIPLWSENFQLKHDYGLATRR